MSFGTKLVWRKKQQIRSLDKSLDVYALICVMEHVSNRDMYNLYRISRNIREIVLSTPSLRLKVMEGRKLVRIENKTGALMKKILNALIADGSFSLYVGLLLKILGKNKEHILPVCSIYKNVDKYIDYYKSKSGNYLIRALASYSNIMVPDQGYIVIPKITKRLIKKLLSGQLPDWLWN